VKIVDNVRNSEKLTQGSFYDNLVKILSQKRGLFGELKDRRDFNRELLGEGEELSNFIKLNNRKQNKRSLGFCRKLSFSV